MSHFLRSALTLYNSAKVLSYVQPPQRAFLLSSVRNIAFTNNLACTAVNEAIKTDEGSKPKENEDYGIPKKGKVVESIPVETGIRYLQSKAYSITYGENPVWKYYRRNFRGAIPPRKTRKTCVRSGKIASNNPCPLCRDNYLVVDPQNTELLKQFISPHTGETLSYKVTGLCQKQHKRLLSAIDIARDKGALTYDVPFRSYNYDEYREL